MYKRQPQSGAGANRFGGEKRLAQTRQGLRVHALTAVTQADHHLVSLQRGAHPVSYTHLRAHETVLDLVCRLLLEKKKPKKTTTGERE